MNKFVRIYALTVCFTTITCMTVSLGIGLYDVLQMTFPDLMMDTYQAQMLRSDDSFRQSYQNNPGAFSLQASGMIHLPMTAKPDGAPPSDEEVSRLRLERLDAAHSSIRYAAKRSLLQIFIILLVSGPLFYVHWRLANKPEVD